MIPNMVHCPVCKKKLAVLESKAKVVSGVETIWRRKACRDSAHRAASAVCTMELPEGLVRDVLLED